VAAAFLAGSYEPFDAARLKSLYPGGREDYMAKFSVALADTVSKGFLLPTETPKSALWRRRPFRLTWFSSTRRER
jgi:hypothetical protein